jgi:hypothetical protein
MAKTRKKSKTKKKSKVKLATNHAIGVLHLGKKDNFKDLVELMKDAAEQYLDDNGRPNDTSTYTTAAITPQTTSKNWTSMLPSW